MKSQPRQLIFIAMLLASCVPARPGLSPTSTSIPNATMPLPTNTPATYILAQEPGLPSYPTCLIHSNVIYAATPTASASTRGMDVRLSNGLALREGDTYELAALPIDPGCYYSSRDRVHDLQIDLDNGFQVITVPMGNEKELVRVMQDGKMVYETDVSTLVYSGLLQAWGYGNHWAIEVVTQANMGITRGGESLHEAMNQLGLDVIRDGESLRELGGYEKVFAFQLMANKPFFFYKRPGGTFGINFDGRETDLAYHELPYWNPHPGLDASIIQFQNMVLFGAARGHATFGVAVGVFNP